MRGSAAACVRTARVSSPANSSRDRPTRASRSLAARRAGDRHPARRRQDERARDARRLTLGAKSPWPAMSPGTADAGAPPARRGLVGAVRGRAAVAVGCWPSVVRNASQSSQVPSPTSRSCETCREKDEGGGGASGGHRWKSGAYTPAPTPSRRRVRVRGVRVARDLDSATREASGPRWRRTTKRRASDPPGRAVSSTSRGPSRSSSYRSSSGPSRPSRST
jgi:hypothetical protein